MSVLPASSWIFNQLSVVLGFQQSDCLINETIFLSLLLNCFPFWVDWQRFTLQIKDSRLFFFVFSCRAFLSINFLLLLRTVDDVIKQSALSCALRVDEFTNLWRSPGHSTRNTRRSMFYCSQKYLWSDSRHQIYILTHNDCLDTIGSINSDEEGFVSSPNPRNHYSHFFPETTRLRFIKLYCDR